MYADDLVDGRMVLRNRGSWGVLKDVSEIAVLCLSLGVRWFRRVEERGWKTRSVGAD